MQVSSSLREARAWWRAWAADYNRVRPTSAGLWFVAIMIGVTVAALNTGNNLVYLVLASLMGLLMVNNLLAEWNLRGLTVQRQLPAEVHAMEPARGALVVINRRRWGDAFVVEVAEQDGGRAHTVVPRVPAGGRAEAPAEWTFPDRGVQRYAVVRVGSAYPFGLVRRFRDLDIPGEILVYPSAERGAPPVAAAGEGPGASTRGGADATGEFHGLRPYQEGDPIRRIHWGISARIGEPTVVLRAGESGSEVLILVEALPPGPARERAIRRACGRVLWHCARGDAVGLVAEGVEVAISTGASHRRRMLTTLALLPDAERLAGAP